MTVLIWRQRQPGAQLFSSTLRPDLFVVCSCAGQASFLVSFQEFFFLRLCLPSQHRTTWDHRCLQIFSPVTDHHCMHSEREARNVPAVAINMQILPQKEICLKHFHIISTKHKHLRANSPAVRCNEVYCTALGFFCTNRKHIRPESLSLVEDTLWCNCLVKNCFNFSRHLSKHSHAATAHPLTGKHMNTTSGEHRRRGKCLKV